MKEFVVAFINHSKLGYVLESYIVEQNIDNQNFDIISNLNETNIDQYNEVLSESDKKIFLSINNTSIHSFNQRKFGLFNVDGKSILNYDNKKIEKEIKPEIAESIVKTIEIIKKQPVRIFIKEAGKSFINKFDELQLHTKIIEPNLSFYRKTDSIEYGLKLENIILKDKLVTILTNDPCFFVTDNILYQVTVDSKKITPFLTKDKIIIPKTSEIKWFEIFGLNTINKFEIETDGFEIVEKDNIATPILSIVKNIENKLAIDLQYKYENFLFSYYEKHKTKSELIIENDNIVIQKFNRDSDSENYYLEQLKTIGLIDNNKQLFTISDNCSKRELIDWLIENKEIIKTKKILINPKDFSLDPYKVTSRVKESGNYFEIHINFQIGDENYPITKLKENFLRNIDDYTLKNTSKFIIPQEWFDLYTDILNFSNEMGDYLMLPKYYFNLLENLNTTEEIKEKYQKAFESSSYQSIELPKHLNAMLRPYQEIGYKWLYNLNQYGFGACLADDMGLGKTIQVISLLLKLKEENSIDTNFDFPLADTLSKNGKKLTHLIVMPKSLIYNWQTEINKFAPKLKPLIYYGYNRHNQIQNFRQYDVIISTYGTVRADIEKLKKLKFEYVILDESQGIKNSSSARYRAIIKLNSNNRIIMTGTPIENSLADLWSQFNFLNPKLLGGYSKFEKLFQFPIEVLKSERHKNNLENIIKPFLLRRLKTVVAQDLPDKIEKTIMIQMNNEHQSFYESRTTELKSEIRNCIREKQRIKSFIIQDLMLTAIHPKLKDENYLGGSEKFEEIKIHIDKILTKKKSKVLLFSNFVKHLDIIEEYFKEKKLNYSKLIGALTSKEREKQIEKFNNNEDVKFFLISKKAGGIGLNLTSADYVFLLDPWWNPSVENQSIDRTHRIGQTKNVIVYKFITKDTIEEKIESIKLKKTELSESIIKTSDTNDSLFNPENLLELL
jgi:SNF2 family DNA or RNA helicase